MAGPVEIERAEALLTTPDGQRAIFKLVGPSGEESHFTLLTNDITDVVAPRLGMAARADPKAGREHLNRDYGSVQIHPTRVALTMMREPAGQIALLVQVGRAVLPIVLTPKTADDLRQALNAWANRQ